MLKINSVKSSRISVMAALGLFVKDSYSGIGSNPSCADLPDISKVQCDKFKSLVDIREEWLRKINPERDIFLKLNKKEFTK